MTTIQAKVTIELEIDIETYNVPLDHDVSYELSDILHNTFYESRRNRNNKCQDHSKKANEVITLLSKYNLRKGKELFTMAN